MFYLYANSLLKGVLKDIKRRFIQIKHDFIILSYRFYLNLISTAIFKVINKK
ncbi:hypothetical protein SAMN05421796_110120 [Chryseobacterium piscicola]|uniref:Uncharacterized protein n=1 Tax=Chryseobacterium piscicola TaxID=551459 RepID=A0A1N7P3D7_9FLAO|nr:hypothetical protein SAMN05421796_110120 [Chryseobacterium piscicola]